MGNSGTAVPSKEEMLRMNPEFEKLFTDLAIPRSLVTPTTTIHDLKKSLKGPPPSGKYPGVTEEDRKVPTRGGEITVRLYMPDSVAEKDREKEDKKDLGPLFVHYHGGGYCLGNLQSEEGTCRKFVERFGGCVVSVDYRLAPEHPFPTPVSDAYEALKWVSKNISSLPANPSKGFLIGGVSAGGTMSITLSHLYRDDDLQPPLTGGWYSIPSFVQTPSAAPSQYRSFLTSWEENKNSPIIDAAVLTLLRQSHNPDTYSPLCSPLLFPSHRNLPKAYVQVCGLDPLRDFGLLYEKVLREQEGTPTRLDVFNGLPHCFWSFGWLKGSQCERDWWEKTVKGWEWLLEGAK